MKKTRVKAKARQPQPFSPFSILGYNVTDRVTGLEGVCCGVCEFLYGAPRIAVTPVKLKAGLPAEMIWMDVPRLKIGKLHTQTTCGPATVKLGTAVTDKMTKFKGIATGLYFYLNGCIRVEVTPDELKNGQPMEAAVFDEQRITGKKEGPGGPFDKVTPLPTCR